MHYYYEIQPGDDQHRDVDKWVCENPTCEEKGYTITQYGSWEDCYSSSSYYDYEPLDVDEHEVYEKGSCDKCGQSFKHYLGTESHTDCEPDGICDKCGAYVPI